MKLLYLINFAGKAGTEKYVENLVRIFSEAGHECHFAYNVPGELSEKMAAMGIPSLRLDMDRSGALKSAGKLADYCAAHGIEVIHAQYPRENIIALLARRRYKSVRVVYTNHLTIYAPAGSCAEKYTRGASRNTCPCGAARFAQKGMQKNTRSPSWRSKRRD